MLAHVNPQLSIRLCKADKLQPMKVRSSGVKVGGFLVKGLCIGFLVSF